MATSFLVSAADGATCTVEELERIITAPSGGFTMLPDTDMDQVYPNLWVGEEGAAKNCYGLKQKGITHVLNTADGPKDGYHCHISPVHYKKPGIEYKSIKATDMMNFRLDKFFTECADYIEEAMMGGGSVLVNCRQGVSRSATIALAFLMLKRHLTAQDALRRVRAQREVCPNDGFLQQLCDLNDRLHAQGHFKVNLDVKDATQPEVEQREAEVEGREAEVHSQ